MSLLNSPRRPSSDDLEPDLHVGFDRELDLSAERPHGPPAERGRGSGLLVAGIVASSLLLAGVIMLVRGDANEAVASEPAPSPAASEVVAAPSEPGLEAVPSEPIPPTSPSPGPVAAHQPVAPAPAPSADPTLADGPSSPAAVSPAATASAATTPAASTPAHPTAGPPAPPSDPPPGPAEVGSGGLELPPPMFDEPTPAPEPAPVDDSTDPLPGVEEPSIFAPDDEDDADEPDVDEHGTPSSATTPDRDPDRDSDRDGEVARDDDRVLSDAPAA